MTLPEKVPTHKTQPCPQVHLLQQDSQSFLWSILNGTIDPIFVKDRQHRWVFLNDAFCTFMGRERVELIGKSDYDFFPIKEADVFWEKEELVFTTGIPEENEELFTDAQGETRIIHSKKCLFHDETGNPFLVGSIRQIAFRGQIETELRESTQLAMRQTENRLRRHSTALQQLVQSETLQQDDFQNAMKVITEVASFGLDVDRVSVWLYTQDHSKIQCADLYERPNNLHSARLELCVDDYPNYFAALEAEQIIAVADVHTDPRTSDFSENYTLPLCITSMLDARIWSRGKVVGVVCCEHLLSQRQWTLEEENFIGSITDFVRLVIESSDRKTAEAALAESEERFRSLVETVNDLIWEVDENGVYTYVSPQVEAILGYTPEEVVGKTPFDLMPKQEVKRIVPIFQHQIAHKLPLIELENTNIHKQGHLVVLETSGVPILDQAGNIRGYRGIDRDITERKRVQEALRQQAQELEKTLKELQRTQAQMIQAEKMSSLGQLVAGLAHEINNPVNFIYGNITPANGYIQNLLNLIRLYQEHYPEPVRAIREEMEAIELEFLREDLPKLLSSIQMGADRIQQIILSLRTFSRLDEAEYKAVDIHEGIDSTLLILENRLKAKPDRPAIEVSKKYGNLPLIECYAGQLNQVFINILTNAIDALEERDKQRTFEQIQQSPSKILICTQMSNDHRVAIKIADNGLGIPEQIKQRIFDPFFTTKSVGKGTGMGMSISYQIVTENHGGTFQCISSPGQGAEFVIEIPVKQQVKS